MNLVNYEKLKPKYKRIFSLIVIVGIGLSAYPTWEASGLLASFLNIDPHAPIKSQENGLFWFIGFLAVGTLFLVLSCVVLSFIIALYKNWSLKQTLDYFVRYENFPKHWLKY